MATPEIKPIKQFAKAGDNYAGRGSSDGTYIYVPSVTAGIATLSKYDLKGTLIWEKVLSQGGSGATSVIAPDGSILVASSSGGASGKSSALAKFNSLGEKLWEITNAYPEFGAIAIRENTIYVGGGTTTGFNSAKTAFINAYTLDTGKLVWNKTYPNTGASGIGDIRIDGDQIYVSAGPYGKQDFDYAMAGRLDLDGNIIWWKNGPSSDWNNLGSIKIIGNSVIGTGYKADGGDRMDARIMSFNISDGTIQWDKSWGDSNAQGGNSIESLNGKLYVSYSDGVGWNTGSNNTGFTVVDELDTSGNLLKSYKFDVPSSYDGAGSLVKVGESLYLLGQTNGTITGQSSGGGYDIFLASLIEADTKKPTIRGNSLYTIVDGPSWTQAEANSVKLGGHLVAVNSEEEQKWILNRFNPTGPGIWIGFSDQKQEGKWEWSSDEKSSYSNWGYPNEGIGARYEPNGGTSENYAHIWGSNNWHSHEQGTWNDLPNLSSENYYHTLKGLAETPFIRRGDSAYVIVQGPTWEEAEANAVKLGGHLVTINDAAENQWISDTFRDRLALPDSNWNNGLRAGSWIGLNDKEVDGVPKWADGTEVTYTNFLREIHVKGLAGSKDGWLTVMLDPSGVVQSYAGLNSWSDVPVQERNDYWLYKTGIAEIKLAPNNTPTGTPTVAGTFKVGSTLTIDATAIKDSDNFTGYSPTFNYNWETSTDGTTWSKLSTTDGADNNNTYILTASEVGKKIRGVVSYLDGYGTNEVVNSAASAPITSGAPPVQSLTLNPPSKTAIRSGISTTSAISYTVSTGEINLTGVGASLYFDSTQLSVSIAGDPFKTGLLGNAITADTSNADGDPKTDKVLSLSYLDFGGNFPGSGITLPLVLANLNLVPTTTFSGSTLHLKGDPATGYTATGADLSIAHNGAPVVDGSIPALSTNRYTPFSYTLKSDLFSDPDSSITLSATTNTGDTL
ncbi:lectin-like protein, partial [Synechococcus lacustris]